MSLPEQEARALDRAHDFLLKLGSNMVVDRIGPVRAEARDIVKHFPLAAGYRWAEFNGVDPPEDCAE